MRGPYTGEAVVFAKADAGRVDIDHVVALAEAWRTGAALWTPADRVRYANDPRNLAAASAAVNSAKGDKDAADWSPDGADRRCAYARRVVAVKTTYDLTVDVDERTALAGMLGDCPRKEP
jgi:hypothetical protein